MRDTHAPRQILRQRHTANERAARILLECILVLFFFGLSVGQCEHTIFTQCLLGNCQIIDSASDIKYPIKNVKHFDTVCVFKTSKFAASLT